MAYTFSLTLGGDFDSPDLAAEFFQRIADVFGKAEKAVQNFVERAPAEPAAKPAVKPEPSKAAKPALEPIFPEEAFDQPDMFPEEPKDGLEEVLPPVPEEKVETKKKSGRQARPSVVPAETSNAITLDMVRSLGHRVCGNKDLGAGAVMDTMKRLKVKPVERYDNMTAEQLVEAYQEWTALLDKAKADQKERTDKLVSDAKAKA